MGPEEVCPEEGALHVSHDELHHVGLHSKEGLAGHAKVQMVEPLAVQSVGIGWEAGKGVMHGSGGTMETSAPPPRQ